MLETLKKILDNVIPLNGSKLVIGGWLSALALLQQIVPGLDLFTLITMLSTHAGRAALALLIVGGVHKYLKAKYPDAEPVLKGELPPSIPLVTK